jgi:hypothetical protein
VNPIGRRIRPRKARPELANLGVNRAATTVKLQASINPAATGRAVNSTATVAAVAPGGASADRHDHVPGWEGGAGNGRGPPRPSGVFHDQLRVRGRPRITVMYNGDANFLDGSQVLTEQVNATRNATMMAAD